MPVRTVKRTLGRIRRLYKSPVGAPPGHLHIDPEAPKPELTAISYGPDQLEEHTLTTLDALDEMRAWEVLWVNCSGLGDANTLTGLQTRFGLHPLAMEDVVNVHQRPKVETYDDQLFIVARAHYADGSASEQIAFFVLDNVVLTFQERVGDPFEPVRQRIRHGRGRIRKMDGDYLAYALLDAVVDAFFPVLENLGDHLEDLEAVVFGRTEGRSHDVSSRINELRWALLSIRRSIWPLRELLRSLQSDETVRFGEDVQVFLRDCADHVMQALDHVETYQHMAGALMDGHLSLASHRMNEVMKVLTMIATIFIPLSFVAGLYGMNFDTESPYNMPELSWRFGYPAVWVIMASVAIAMLFFFRRKGWFRD